MVSTSCRCPTTRVPCPGILPRLASFPQPQLHLVSSRMVLSLGRSQKRTFNRALSWKSEIRFCLLHYKNLFLRPSQEGRPPSPTGSQGPGPATPGSQDSLPSTPYQVQSKKIPLRLTSLLLNPGHSCLLRRKRRPCVPGHWCWSCWWSRRSCETPCVPSSPSSSSGIL